MKRPRWLICLAAILIWAVAVPAPAQDQTPPPASAYPEREVQRPIILAPKLAELGVDCSSISTDQRLDEDGRISQEAARYNLFTVDLGGRWSPWSWAEFSFTVPFLTGEIGEVTGGGIGDLRVGARFDPTPPGDFDFTIDLLASLPTGDNQYHFTLVDDEPSLENFRTGDPSYNYYPGFSLRQIRDNYAVRARFYYILTTADTVVYNRLGGYEEDVEADPGDGWFGSVGLYYQAAPQWVVFADASYKTLSETKIDHVGMGDDGYLIKVTPGVQWQMTPEVDLALSLGVPVFGTNQPLAYPVNFTIKSRF